jgi:hypothetical protein
VANSEVRNNDTYGVQYLELKPTSYSWRFVPEAGKTFTDSGFQACHDANGQIAKPLPLNGAVPIGTSTYTDTNVANGTTYHYVVTAVDTSGNESFESSGVNATPGTSTSAIYVDDSFGRTTSNGWGSAPTGGAYTISGTAANFSVAGGVGVMVAPNAGALRSALIGPSVADVDVSFSVAANKSAAGSHQFIYAVVRRNGNNEYRVKLRFDANGNVYVGASRVVNNAETDIGSMLVVPGLTHPANAIIHFRAQVSGASPTTLKVRAWADGSAEPTTWTYSQTDSTASLQAAGALGLRTYIASATSNAPITFSFDDYRVTSIAP